MTPRRDLRVYIRDILEHMDAAEEFLGGVTFEAFCRDKKTAFAVVRCIEVIGEAAKHVPAVMRRKQPRIPWKEMAGMRDKLAHEYFGVVLEVVWRTVKEDLPPLRPLLEGLLRQAGGPR